MSPQLQAHDLLAMRPEGMSLDELKQHITKLREVHEMLCAISQALGISASSRMDALHLMRRIVQQLEQAQLLVEEIQANCGFELLLASTIDQTEPPTEKEMRLLHEIDPRGMLIGK